MTNPQSLILADLSRKYNVADRTEIRLLHHFNPSHEIALADNSSIFLPNSMVRKMEEQLSDFPRLYADNNDAIIRPDGNIVDIKGNLITDFDGMTYIPFPWGWNNSVRRFYLKHGCDMSLMPDESEIDIIRNFASRKFASGYMHRLACHFDDEYADSIVGRKMMFFDNLEGLSFANKGPMIFKQLWSSSGRGNFIADSVDKKAVDRLSGFVRTQGGFVSDVFYNKIIDFAMEFYVFSDGKVVFLGYSLFKTDNGRYMGNMVDSQENIKKEILCVLKNSSLLDEIKNYHISALERDVAGKYVGFVGIDMMVVDNDGHICCHPCVEMNFRLNMGIVAMNAYLRRFFLEDVADEEGADVRSSNLTPSDDKRERGFHTAFKSRFISIRYS